MWQSQVVLVPEGLCLYINTGTLISTEQFMPGCVALLPFLCSPKERKAVLYEQAKLSQQTQTLARVAGSVPEASADTAEAVKDYSSSPLLPAHRAGKYLL